MNPERRAIAVTPGEPAGIGPDLLIQLIQQPQAVPLVAIADPDLLQARAMQLGLPLRLLPFAAATCPPPSAAKQLYIHPVKLAEAAIAGRLNPANSAYVLECLRQAVAGCRQNTFAAMVTGPVHKGVINQAGVAFSGHTEFLAEQTDTARVVMMLATAGLRVALATTHLPLKDVAAAITPDSLERILQILHHSLIQQFGLPRPRILVCGLNPHAGEDGHLGREEIEVISPVLERLRGQGMDLIGPLPADTLFTPARLEKADAVLAMYHDQGLPVLKYRGFGQAVNITLGLPLIRTSVDHGTALDLAASGNANSGSLRVALDTALQMVRQQPASPSSQTPPMGH